MKAVFLSMALVIFSSLALAENDAGTTETTTWPTPQPSEPAK